jgi:pimeloyl-ACP methyl ester carboxylesterase
MDHGDGFAPHPALRRFARQQRGIFFYDSAMDAAFDLSAKTVVLVHGNGDEADTWRHVFTPLSEHHRVLALDLPGFGRSATDGAGDLEALSAALSKLIDHQQLERPHLVGSSLGAVICAALVAQQPQRFSSLVIAGGASPALGGLEASAAIAPLLTPGSGEAYYNGLREAGQEAAFRTLQPYYHHLDSLPEADQTFLSERVWARVHSDSQRDAFFAALRDLFAPTARLEVPNDFLVQLIWGEADQIVPLEQANRIAQQIPQAHLKIISKAGHLPHQEQPAAWLETLLAHLE